jgi:hypothetical protein
MITSTKARMERPACLSWLRSLRAYLGTIALGNLVWEFLHLPLYTIWTTGTPREQAFAVVHCWAISLLL